MCLLSDLYNITGIRELAIPVYENLTNFYTENQKILLLEAIKYKSSIFDNLISLKGESIRRFRENIQLLNLIKTLSSRHNFRYSSDLMTQINFQKYEDDILPSPVIPFFFSEMSEQDSANEIISLITDPLIKNAVQNILINSDLTCDIFGFRTVLKNGQSVIQGRIDNTFSSLRSLAHEIGHCLFEINNDYTHIYGNILSELFATIFEQGISEIALVNRKACSIKIAENRHYCQMVLRLDILFYMKEIADLLGETCTFFKILDHTCVFRPSYFLGTGIQIINGESAILFEKLKSITYSQNQDIFFDTYKKIINNVQPLHSLEITG